MTSQTATRPDPERSSLSTLRGTAMREAAVPQTPPTQIGRFVVLRKLGEGGMGVVYAAYDEELERKVAIKLLRGEFHGQRQSVGQARLQREAQAMARLSHPNIVQVYEVGPFGSGVFMAMEFVHGCDLREWRQSERTWQATLAVYMQAGQGLAAAHAAGIVHRDFKPDNVLLGEDLRVRVMDFGLARPDDGGRDEVPGVSGVPGVSSSRLAVELTQAGSFVGTPAYMSPEQLRHESADAKSDQFSFCVALYEALYGFRPFPGKDTSALREAVLFDEPLPAPRGTDVPGWVHQALLRGLSREPEKRYRDMPELLAVLAADPSARRRRRWGIAGVVLASGLAAGGGGVAMYEWRAASAAVCDGGEARLAGVWDAPVAAATREALVGTGVQFAEDVATRVSARLDAYATEWIGMHREACETHQRGEQSDALFDLRMACLDERRTGVQALTRVLAEADAEVVTKAVQAAEELPTLERCTNTRALLAQSPPPEDPETERRAEALMERLATLWAKRRVGQSKAIAAEVSVVRGEAEALGYARVTGDAFRLEGGVALELGDYKAAEAALVRAVAHLDGAGDDDMRAGAQVDLVEVVGLHQARFEEAHRLAELTRGTLRRLVHPDFYESLLALRYSQILLQQHAFDEAGQVVERSIELQRRVHGEKSWQFATALGTRGTLHFFRGELAEALVDYREAAEVDEEVYGVNHPMLGEKLNNIGAVELTQFDSAAAARTFTRAQQILVGAYGETHPMLGALHMNLAIAALFEGRHAQAIDEFQRALASYEKHLPANHPTIAECLNEYAEALVYAGDLAAALKMYARSLDVHVEAFGVGHAKVSVALANLGLAQLRAADLAGAERSFMRAMGEFSGAVDEALLGRAFAGLGALRLAQGRVEEAVTNLEASLERLRRNPGAAPFHVAEAQFALARALMQRGPGNEQRARSLAADAESNYSRVGPGFQAEARQVRVWLDQLPTAG